MQRPLPVNLHLTPIIISYIARQLQETANLQSGFPQQLALPRSIAPRTEKKSRITSVLWKEKINVKTPSPDPQ